MEIGASLLVVLYVERQTQESEKGKWVEMERWRASAWKRTPEVVEKLAICSRNRLPPVTMFDPFDASFLLREIFISLHIIRVFIKRHPFEWRKKSKGHNCLISLLNLFLFMIFIIIIFNPIIVVIRSLLLSSLIRIKTIILELI